MKIDLHVHCRERSICCKSSQKAQVEAAIAAGLDAIVFTDHHRRDLRRIAETHLAKIGVAQDIRAQLLSHGISGVQARHYDQHGYEKEKRATLERWEIYLMTGLVIPTEVVKLADRRNS